MILCSVVSHRWKQKKRNIFDFVKQIKTQRIEDAAKVTVLILASWSAMVHALQHRVEIMSILKAEQQKERGHNDSSDWHNDTACVCVCCLTERRLRCRHTGWPPVHLCTLSGARHRASFPPVGSALRSETHTRTNIGGDIFKRWIKRCDCEPNTSRRNAWHAPWHVAELRMLMQSTLMWISSSMSRRCWSL